MKTIQCKDHTGKVSEYPLDKFSFRPTVYAFIVKNGKMVMLTNKSNAKLWFPGGGVELGEKLEAALRREVKEETGLEFEIEKLAYVTENFFYRVPDNRGYHAHIFFYLCRPLAEELISDEKVDDEESTQPRWIYISDIQKESLTDLNGELYPILQSLR